MSESVVLMQKVLMRFQRICNSDLGSVAIARERVELTLVIMQADAEIIDKGERSADFFHPRAASPTRTASHCGHPAPATWIAEKADQASCRCQPDLSAPNDSRRKCC